MRRPLIALCLLAMPLAACSTVGSIAGIAGNVATNTPIVSLSSTNADERAEALAWDGYYFCARTFNATKASMDPALKTTLRGLLDKAYPALQSAHSFRLAGNAQSFTAQLGLANQAITQAKALIPPAQGH